MPPNIQEGRKPLVPRQAAIDGLQSVKCDNRAEAATLRISLIETTIKISIVRDVDSSIRKLSHRNACAVKGDIPLLVTFSSLSVCFEYWTSVH